MNERVAPKMINFCVVKLSNSPAITYVPRLELDGPTFRHFESQHDSPRINQRLPGLGLLLFVEGSGKLKTSFPDVKSDARIRFQKSSQDS